VLPINAKRSLRTVIAGLALAAAAAGCATIEAAVEELEQLQTTPSIAANAADAAADLDALGSVKRQAPNALNYDRNAFGRSWADVDGNGCNQRDDVLMRDAVKGTVRVARQGACDHDVLAGQWRDPYTGKLLTFDNLKDPKQSTAIQIDHVVPLAEAWVSGASTWSAAKLNRYANDLSLLLAADGPTNSSKGHGDPAAWRPRKAYQCQYAKHWISIKKKWDLRVDSSERDALIRMLATCS
jgi:hypothetical protein